MKDIFYYTPRNKLKTKMNKDMCYCSQRNKLKRKKNNKLT